MARGQCVQVNQTLVSSSIELFYCNVSCCGRRCRRLAFALVARLRPTECEPDQSQCCLSTIRSMQMFVWRARASNAHVSSGEGDAMGFIRCVCCETCVSFWGV